ncbi:MAG: hypothetical protein ABI380_12815 [Edaphobacter sp.]
MRSRLRLNISGILALVLLCTIPIHAQDAKSLVEKAVHSELAADQNDRSLWRYRDEQRDANKVSVVVNTHQGSAKRLIEKNGQPLTEAETQAEDARLQNFINDSSKLAKQKKDAANDDKNATALLRMLPEAFIWTAKSHDAETLTLHFEPDPNFSAPDMQSRVLSAMNGDMQVNEKQQRIQSISGRLTRDVTFGYGLFGRLREGGTFHVIRREVAPTIWEITETHVHIEGKALLFKNIGQQQDEVQTDFTPVPAGTTLEQAIELSKELSKPKK